MNTTSILEKIKKIYEGIYASTFTINPIFKYQDLADQFVELAEALVEYNGESEDWIYLGEGSECQLGDMVVGAFWHYTEWHAGQSSRSYEALSSLGKIYQPNMEQPPSEDDEHSMEGDCYRRLNYLAKESNS